MTEALYCLIPCDLEGIQLLFSKNASGQLQEQQRIMSKWEIDYLYHYQNKQATYG
jgi:hypothetical protein